MTGVVTGAEGFIIASYVVTGVVLAALTAWSAFALMSAKRRKAMLDELQASTKEEA